MTRLITVALWAILWSNVAMAETFKSETFTLENGMQVVLIENQRTPALAHMVWYKSGSAREDRGKSGIAHFLEHLMFKGTEKFSADTFSKTVAALGGQDNAFTSQDYTAYYQVIPREGLERVMEMEADRMTNLRLDDHKTVFSERDVILEERRQRVENDPAAILEESAWAGLFRNHPYGVPIIGWEKEIANLGPDDALDFYRRHYTPENAILVVSGAIGLDELKPLAEKYYGTITPRGAEKPVAIAEPPRRTAQRLSYSSEHVRRAQWQRLWLLDRCVSDPDQSAVCGEAFEILAKAWGGGATSFLYRHLVVRDKLASAVYAGYDEWRDYAVFSIDAVPAEGVSTERLQQAIEKLLSEWKGIDDKTLARAKRQLVASAVYARDGLLGPGTIVGARLAIGDSVDDIEQWPARVKAVDKADVDAAADRVRRDLAPLTAVLEKHAPRPLDKSTGTPMRHGAAG